MQSTEVLSAFLHWSQAHPQLLSLALLFSVLVLLGTVLLAPFLAARIPADYFSDPEQRTLHARNLPLRILRLLLKNALGVVLLVLGIVMLVTPGQGLLTIFVALLALDYPGKYRLERWLVSRPAICRGINWLRARGGAAPLQVSCAERPEAANR